MTASRAATGCLLVALVSLMAPLAQTFGQPNQTDTRGIIVVDLAPGGALSKAGLEVGDILVAWQSGQSVATSTKPFTHPADALRVEIEQATCQPVTALVRRGDQSLSITPALGRWGLMAMPRLSDQETKRYETAIEQSDAQAVVDQMTAIANELNAKGQPDAATWILLEAWFQLESDDPRLEEVAMAGQVMSLAAGPEVQSWYDEVAGLESFYRGDLARAQQVLRRSHTTRLSMENSRMLTARSATALAFVAEDLGDLDGAEKLHKEALILREQDCVSSLSVASSVNNLGGITFARGDLALARQYFHRALKIRREIDPLGMETAESLSNLGQIAYERGDLLTAESMFNDGLAIIKQLDKESFQVAAILTNLGAVAYDRGDIVAAEDYYQQALKLEQKLAPDTLDVALDINNLGELYSRINLHSRAEAVHRKALAIQREHATDSLDVAFSLNAIGVALLAQQSLPEAEAVIRQALHLREQLNPDSLDVADSLILLGEVLAARKEFVVARQLLERAVHISRTLASESAAHARSNYRLAVIQAEMGDLDAALGSFHTAVEAVEAQQSRVGTSPDHRGRFRSQYVAIYRDYVRALVDAGRETEAFEMLERSRAQQLLAMLAVRELSFGREFPAALTQERLRANRRYDEIQSQLAQLSAINDASDVRVLQRQLREVRRQQDDIGTRIHGQSPSLASIQQPRSLSAAEAAKILDKGTLVVAFSVGDDSTSLVFTLDHTGQVSYQPIAIGQQELRKKVEHFRRLITQAEGFGASKSRIQKSGSELYRTLLLPIQERLDAAERILLLPDGPLHLLPFAALSITPTGPYLVEKQRHHQAPSLTVYAETLRRRERRNDRTTIEFLGFGDPLFAEAESSGGLPRLPSSRREVEAIAKLYEEGKTEVYLGATATEELAKATMPHARVIHFATHGLLDSVSPMDSALVLARPKPGVSEENGSLQMWEIIQDIRLTADLVVLSACETALGKERDGEGLIGLTRAFQFAGSRSTIASHWPIADDRTAALMTTLHHHLVSGLSKVDALRQTQLQALASDGEDSAPTASHPFVWASFSLFGDWQ